MNIRKIATCTAIGLAVLAAAPLALPRHVTVERSAVIDAAPEAILALAASNEGYQRFNPYRSLDPDLKIALFGPDTGVGSGFRFDSKDGTGSQTVAEVTAERVVYAVDLGPLGQPRQSIEAIAITGGTEVTWRVDNDLGMNPVFRVFGLFMEGMVGPTFELGLENLADVAA